VAILIPGSASPWSFPGTAPRLNLSHPAAYKCRLAAVATGAGGVNLVTGAKGTLGTNSKVVNTGHGPGLYASAAPGAVTYPVVVAETVTAFTQALIFEYRTEAGSVYPLAPGASYGIQLTPTHPNPYLGGAAIGLTPTLPNSIAGHTYFMAVAAKTGTNGVVVVLVDMTTGAVFQAIGTQSINCILSGTYGAPYSAPVLSRVLAAHYAANYLTLGQMLEWAQNPWALWYDNSTLGVVSSASAQAPSGTPYALAAVQGSYTQTTSGHSLYGMGLYGMGLYSAAPGGATLKVGMPGAQGAYGLTGFSPTLAYRQVLHPVLVVETGAYASTGFPPTFVRPLNYHLVATTWTYALSGKTIALAKTGTHPSMSIGPIGYAVAGFAPFMIKGRVPLQPPVLPPIPALREATYRIRGLGRAYDPTIVVVKDRPGPMRIVEIDAWMN
jgi:hypothetical protein